MASQMLLSARLAARAELVWRDRDGALHATAVVPLVFDDAIVAALPFAQTGVVDRLIDVTRGVLVCSDSRMALKGWTACAGEVAIDVVADRTGEWTWTGALDQEVRKHPPARLLMDTAIQRREHWWYVPRWLVRMRPTTPVRAIPRRRAPQDGLLVTSARTDPDRRRGGGEDLRVRPVAVDDWQATQVELVALDAATAPLPQDTDDALLFGHDFSIPDQERESAVLLRGRVRGNVLHTTAREGAIMLPPSRLLARLRAYYALERACRRALERYDASLPDAAT